MAQNRCTGAEDEWSAVLSAANSVVVPGVRASEKRKFWRSLNGVGCLFARTLHLSTARSRHQKGHGGRTHSLTTREILTRPTVIAFDHS